MSGQCRQMSRMEWAMEAHDRLCQYDRNLPSDWSHLLKSMSTALLCTFDDKSNDLAHCLSQVEERKKILSNSGETDPHSMALVTFSDVLLRTLNTSKSVMMPSTNVQIPTEKKSNQPIYRNPIAMRKARYPYMKLYTNNNKWNASNQAPIRPSINNVHSPIISNVNVASNAIVPFHTPNAINFHKSQPPIKKRRGASLNPYKKVYSNFSRRKRIDKDPNTIAVGEISDSSAESESNENAMPMIGKLRTGQKKGNQFAKLREEAIALAPILNNSVNCFLCKHSCTNWFNFTTHFYSKHRKNNKKPLFMCTFCDISYCTSIALASHILRQKNEGVMECSRSISIIPRLGQIVNEQPSPTVSCNPKLEEENGMMEDLPQLFMQEESTIIASVKHETDYME